MISLDKKYITRRGFPVRLLLINLNNESPVVGVLTYRHNGVIHECIIQWDINGIHKQKNLSHALDLIEIPEWTSYKINDPVIATRNDGTTFEATYAGVYRDHEEYLIYPLVNTSNENPLLDKIPLPVTNVQLIVNTVKEQEISEAQMLEDILAQYGR